MKLQYFALLAAFLGLATAALAGEDAKTKMKIAVVEGEGEGETRIELDSDELGFNLHDMQEGENRSIVDRNGRSILVTREADGFSFEIDGKTIKMPAFHGHHHGPVWINGEGVDDVDVHVMRDMRVGTMHDSNHVMIMSGKPIDETTQQAIKSLLEQAGHDSDVRFIDRESRPGGPHRIKVIEKKIEAAN